MLIFNEVYLQYDRLYVQQFFCFYEKFLQPHEINSQIFILFIF